MFHSLYLLVSKADTVLMEPHTEHASLVLQQSVYRRAALSISEVAMPSNQSSYAAKQGKITQFALYFYLPGGVNSCCFPFYPW